MSSKQVWLTNEQVLTLNERHGWFKHGDAQSDVSRAFANDAVAMHERLRAAAPELLELLERVAYHMEGGIRLEYPASPEESPQPASEWDHEADRLAGEARRLIVKATGGDSCAT